MARPHSTGRAAWRPRAGGRRIGPKALVRLVWAAAFILLSSSARADSFMLAPGQTLVGAPSIYVTRAEDTLLEVARRYDLGYGQLMAANSGIDPWFPGDGRRITLPTVYLVPGGPRTGIVINLAEQRLYYFGPDLHMLETYPIGVGVEAGMTPRGTTRIIGKDVHPTWVPPRSIREERPELPAFIPPGPDNPLGDYALRLGWPGYFIHGTNKPFGVGRNVSHGCIRMYPEDIDRLFHEVAVGTPVRVVDEEVRLAWVGRALYLQVMPNKRQMDEIDVNRPMTPEFPLDLYDRVVAAAGDAADRVDWDLVDRLAATRPGLPMRIFEAGAGDSGLPYLPSLSANEPRPRSATGPCKS